MKRWMLVLLTLGCVALVFGGWTGGKNHRGDFHHGHNPPPDSNPNGNPIALYTFLEGSGNVIHDVSGFRSPLNLKIGNPHRVEWIPGGGLSVDGPALIRSIGNAGKIADALNRSHQFSLEAWIRPADTTGSREKAIVAIKEGAKERISLSQKGQHYRASVQAKSFRRHAGKSNLEIEAAWAVRAKLTHIVLTKDAQGIVRYYEDGILFHALVDTLNGLFSLGKNPALILGGLHDGWQGDFFKVAVYNKALSEDEVKGGFRKGPYPDPDADGNGLPDPVDSLIAYDTNSAFPAPRIFIPSIWNNVPEMEQLITYRSPFFVPHDSNALHYITMSIPAGTLASSLNPVITLLDSQDTRIPSFTLESNQHVLGYFQLFGELSPGASLNLPISFDPAQFRYRDTTLRSPDNIRLYRFNNSTNVWDLIPSKEDGLQTIYAIVDKINGIYAAIHADNVVLVNNQLPTSCPVDPSPARCGRGSWRNAVRSLREAFASALPGDEIWVASDGVTPYLPTDGTGDNTNRATFLALPVSVGVYGGFDGTESTREQRNFLLNPAIISGNIGNTSINTDNSYNIFVGAEGSILDGFVVSDSYTDVDPTQLNVFCTSPFPRCRFGGGLYVENVSQMSVRNCVFRNNVGLSTFNPGSTDPTDFASVGAGIFSSNTPIFISDCRFISNHSNADGSAITIGGGNGAQIINSTFESNISDHQGGAICNGSGSPLYRNCVFLNNTAATEGGAGYEFGNPTGSGTIYQNCTFYGNRSLSSAGGALATAATNSLVPSITNSIFWNNTAATGNNEIDGNYSVSFSISQGTFTGTGNLNANPQFADEAGPLGADGILGTIDDGLRLRGNLSPAYNSGNGTQVFDLLNQYRFASATGGAGDATCFTRFAPPSPFAFNPILIPTPPSPCVALNPDRGAYAVTLSENPRAFNNGVDFLDHPNHRFGFDKIPHDFLYSFDAVGPGNPNDVRQVPNFIYFAMKKKLTPTDPTNTSEPVYVVVQDPTNLYVESSDPTIFTLVNTDATNRINLTRNVATVILTAQAPAGTHASAFLDIRQDVAGPDPLLGRLRVEVYQARVLTEIEVTQLVRTGIPYEIPSAPKFLREARKAFQQAVIEVGAVTVHPPLTSNYDLNNNWRLDLYDASPFSGPGNDEMNIFNAVPYVWNNPANERFIFVDVGTSFTHRIVSPAAMGTSVLQLSSFPALNYGGIEISNFPNPPQVVIAGFDFVPANPITLTIPETSPSQLFPLPQDVTTNDLFFSMIGGLSTNPIMTGAYRNTFQIFAHEILHHILTNLGHVADPTNIMNGTSDFATDLRFRDVPAANESGRITFGSRRQWDEVLRP